MWKGRRRKNEREREKKVVQYRTAYAWVRRERKGGVERKLRSRRRECSVRRRRVCCVGDEELLQCGSSAVLCSLDPESVRRK
jgi:hypothetical protein